MNQCLEERNSPIDKEIKTPTTVFSKKENIESIKIELSQISGDILFLSKRLKKIIERLVELERSGGNQEKAIEEIEARDRLINEAERVAGQLKNTKRGQMWDNVKWLVPTIISFILAVFVILKNIQ